jgi:7,8-dihydro-6-hydroxymethylpterin-pyrophosphokinase
VALVRSGLSPPELLAFAHELERAAGRVAGPRWGPRPLDIDLLLYGDWRTTTPELTIPHPRLRERAFVLAPLADLAPALPLPPDGRTAAQLLALLPGDGGDVERVSWTAAEIA